MIANIMRNKTTAKNLESKFEQGEDVMDYFDLAKASRHLLEKERVNLDIPHWMILKIDRVARRKGMQRQAQIKEWLAQKLKEEEQQAK
jgi:predicted DNA binding CopG/RHH family protein